MVSVAFMYDFDKNLIIHGESIRIRVLYVN